MLCEDYCLPSQCRSSFIYIEPFYSSRSLYKNTFHRYKEKQVGDFRFYSTYGDTGMSKNLNHTHKKPLRDDKCDFYLADNVKKRKKLYKIDICNIKHIRFSTPTTRSTVQHGSSQSSLAQSAYQRAAAEVLLINDPTNSTLFFFVIRAYFVFIICLWLCCNE